MIKILSNLGNNFLGANLYNASSVPRVLQGPQNSQLETIDFSSTDMGSDDLVLLCGYYLAIKEAVKNPNYSGTNAYIILPEVDSFFSIIKLILKLRKNKSLNNPIKDLVNLVEKELLKLLNPIVDIDIKEYNTSFTKNNIFKAMYKDKDKDKDSGLADIMLSSELSPLNATGIREYRNILSTHEDILYNMMKNKKIEEDLSVLSFFRSNTNLKYVSDLGGIFLSNNGVDKDINGLTIPALAVPPSNDSVKLKHVIPAGLVGALIVIGLNFVLNLLDDEAIEESKKSKEERANDAQEEKANDSEANDSKANDSKANDSKANDSKANDSKASDSKANDSEETDKSKPKKKKF
jgi:hypothetical protein